MSLTFAVAYRHSPYTKVSEKVFYMSETGLPDGIFASIPKIAVLVYF
jgi:hypothetical protein